MSRMTPTSPPEGPSVTFYGATHTVTGSMHLVRAGGREILLDCGLFQGPRAEARARNRTFPFAPADLDAVVLSHAHIDHCGNLPNLVKQGFAGPVYCTPATRDLAVVMLNDSAKIQEEDAAYLNKHRADSALPTIEPLYDRRDVHRAARLLQPVPYDRPFDLGRGGRLLLVDAGHILGSAMVALTLDVGGRAYSLTFTGDLGRKDQPILRDPEPVPASATLLCESTYGGKTHPPTGRLAEALRDVVRRTVARGGKVLIPAFSLGRTQTIIYLLHQLITAGQLAPLPVFVDSPLAAAATEVYRLHPECFDEETALLVQEDPDLFGRELVHYVTSVEESKRLNGRREPCVILASSGMCEAGRILHHLKHNLEDERNAVLIVGYQAEGTLGRRLVEKQHEVRVLDRVCRVNAEVVVMNGFSGHADQNELLDALAPLAGATRQVCLVHGEPARSEALRQALLGRGFADVLVPERGQTVALA
jgi:metallo-beta-lactamase family protein